MYTDIEEMEGKAVCKNNDQRHQKISSPACGWPGSYRSSEEWHRGQAEGLPVLGFQAGRPVGGDYGLQREACS